MSTGLDPALLDDFGKLQRLLGALNADMAGLSKSATYQKLLTEKTNEELKKLAKSLGEDGVAIAAKIRAEAEAAKQAEKTKEAYKRAAIGVAEGVGKAVSGITDFAKGITSTATAIHDTEKVFTGVIPTVDLLSNSFKAAISALSTAFSGIPWIGGAIGAVEKATAAYTDIAVAVTKMQLEGAQKLLDSLTNVQKSGLFVAGSFDQMVKYAGQAGMSVSMFNKYLTDNIESFAKFDGSINQAAKRAGDIAKGFRTTDQQLVLMYGSFDALAGATAQYMSLMSQTGRDYRATNVNLNAEAKNYLYSMKELQALTGKNVDTLRKEQEERLRMAAYQNTIAKMGAQGQEIQNRVSLITANAGKEAGDYFAEMVANQGKIMSESGLRFAAMNEPLARMIKEMYLLPTGDKGMGGMARIMEGYAPQLTKFYENQLSVTRLAYATNDETVQMMNRVQSQIMGNLNKFRSATEAVAEFEKNRAAGKTDPAVKPTVAAMEAMVETQKNMDKLFKEFIPQMGDLAKRLYKVTDTLINKFPIEHFDKAVDKFVSVIEKLILEMNDNGPVVQDTSNLRVTGEDVNARRRAAGQPELSPEAAEAQAAREQNIRRPGRRARSTYIDDLTAFKAKIKEGPAGTVQREGRGFDPRLADFLNHYIASDFSKKSGFSVDQITALDDNFHRERGGKHPLGMAVDFTLAKKPTPEQFKEIERQLRTSGFIKVRDEYNDPSPGATGPHIHAELQKGGIVSGGSGGIVARVGEGYKDELVAPLNNGMLPGMQELIDEMRSLVRINRDQLDNLEQTKHLLG